ncbi:hypothetical protein HJC23_004802 [Cyclotella cryptica]|uniref:BSD domain-containing protein n=1 Tax=Cyclotella cryptica TaxID=29204 RepID=A0ABD3PYQ0_9STRA|eukprot:CCRYP_010422-RA/>CCRYP_010422-RA protein AED:0.36 eAED:0.36 QI:0/-1/0/1/-1/1/1/0/304
MGQGTSSPELPSSWIEILPTITGEDILRSSKKRCRVSEDKRVYLDDEIFDLDEHVPLALEILSTHPPLKDVRFKLVPGRMMEERFWAALFGILNDGGVDIDEVVGDVAIDDDYETGDEVEVDNINNNGGSPHGKAAQVHQYDQMNTEGQASADAPPSYLEEIKAQQELISRLQKSLREANHKIRKLSLEVHKERKKRHDEGVSNGETQQEHSGQSPSLCPRCNSKLGSQPQQQHSGHWEMHPDCKEFLKLDEHLKENLRKEKEKRLNEVLSQMKFILDSDEMKDTYGKWSCCGKEEYEAEECKE